MSLVIKRNSWHYQLHQFIRKIWGWKIAPTERWSLCPYFHATLWGSILTILCFPMSITGWLFCKFCRKVYKISDKSSIIGFIGIIVDNTSAGYCLDQAPHRFEKSPMKAGFLWFMYFVLAFIIVDVIFLFGYFILTGGIEFIPQVPHALWVAAIWIGWTVFEIFSLIGFVAIAILQSVIDAVLWSGASISNAFSWCIGIVSSSSFWTKLSIVIAYIVVFSFLCVIATLVSMKIIDSNWFKNSRKWLEMKANGFAEARERREAEAEKLEKELEEINKEKTISLMKEKWGDNYIYFIPEKWGGVYDPEYAPEKLNMKRKQRQIRRQKNDKMYSLFYGIETVISIAYRSIINLYGHWEIKKSTGKEQTEQKVFILGPIGVIVEFIKAAKKGVCPLLEFVDEKDLGK